MTFEEHLENHRNADGSYDLDAAEEDRRYELETDPSEIVRHAATIAKGERAAYLKQETTKLRKQFQQPALSPSLELDVKVPLGSGIVVRLGEMNHVRIRTRKDLRLDTHLAELRAFDVELTHWKQTESLLNEGETIEEAVHRLI